MASNADKTVKLKLALLRLADELGNVSKACNLLGYSRDSYYRFKQLYEAGGVDALKASQHRRPHHKNRVPTDIENQLLRTTYAHPVWGAVTMARELRRRGATISPAGVRCVWLRYNLETIAKRMETLQSPEKSQTNRTVSSAERGESADLVEN